MINSKYLFFSASLLLFYFSVPAQSSIDSVKKSSVLIFTSRLNSTGHFPYTGSIINQHLNFDLNIYYEKNRYGFFIFKSIDLEDRHSIINYLQPGIFRNFKIGRHIEAGPYIGYVFSQTQHFRDKDSDFWAAGVISYNNGIIEIQNTALVLNLSEEQSLRTLANRLFISFPINLFKVDLYIWERIIFKTQFYCTSAALALTLPEVKLSNKVRIKSTFSYQGYLTTRKPDYAMRKGFIFTIAVPVSK